MARVTVTVADFRAQFPQFAATADALIQNALEEALLLHSVRKLSTLYAAAHVLSFQLVPISGGGSSGGSTAVTGQVTSHTVGPLSTTYATHSGTTTNSNNTKSATDVAFFSSTIYGQHFLALEARTPRVAIGAIVAG